MKVPIDLTVAWEAHVQDVLADRDPHRISASDLHGCDRAFFDRYNGADQLPYTNSSFSAFERGHAYESRVYEAFAVYAVKNGMACLRAGDLTIDGIEGHPDFVLYPNRNVDLGVTKPIAVIDPTTTASQSSDWGYGHALKSAFYAVALDVDLFCEFVICIGFGGNILKTEPHWFHLDEVPVLIDDLPGKTWRERVTLAMAHSKALAASEVQPAPIPPNDPKDGILETWRCKKGYCRNAVCPANTRLKIPMSAAH